VIRLRRIAPRGLLRRPRYEIEFPAAVPSDVPRREETSTPVTAIDPYVGVGDAWTLVHAANDAWDGQAGEWVDLVNASE
jgi:hypothetical protein